MHTRLAIEDVVRAMSAKPGYSPAATQRLLIEAWQRYEREQSQLRIVWGAEKFFSDGHWRTPEAWQRKQEDQKRPFDPCALQPIVIDDWTSKIDECFGIKPGDLDLWREKRDRGETIAPEINFALDRKSRKGKLSANDTKIA
jgi:hypothetical protein